ncbi:16S rRNA (adenine(1518)-N(6)/adenine(1519)-N(6))-dimethyltransferase RsmA [Candidatus Pelagibacter sp.]|nr:16S rRNA (adenine(1518)-N(6)/adenine(1519)-N(6))-dimethyltransferase RsmA [Candidatus Pelagibacter sp.]
MKINPKKSLGQNFLIDKNIIEKICDAANITRNNNVLEIGPGTGNLTDFILQKKPKKFHVIEKDERLIKNLNQRFDDKITIINEDILKYDLKLLSDKDLIIFGNLPYNISSQILTNFINYPYLEFSYKKLVFMFQKEVADRILAKDNSKNYGRLSIFSSWKLNIKKIMDINPSSFFPKPKVMSSLLIFEPKINYIKFKNSKNLEHITNVFFNQRRKMIKKPINILFKNSETVIKDLNLDTNLRPQNLKKDTFYKICLIYEKLIK